MKKRMSIKNRKIINRSGTAVCDMCEEMSFLERHHIRGRNIPDADNPSNVANICPKCHTEVHYGKKIIEGWYLSTKGRMLIWHEDQEESLTGDDANPHQFLDKK
jgi:hypothetical protein